MKTVSSLILLAAMISSCSPRFYTPNSQNIPMMREQGQTVVTGGGSGSRAELQAAYGLTDHIAVQANGGLFFPKNIENGDGGSGHFVEGGIGYYKPVYQSFSFETYALLGGGRVENHLLSTTGSDPGTNGKLDATIMRYGLQPSFSYVTKYFTVGLSTRIAMLNYSDISGNLVYASENQQQYLQDNNNNFLFEPALTMRGGSEKLKLQIQFIRSYNFSNPKFKQDFNAATIGLNYRF